MEKKGEEALVSCGTTKGPVVMRMHRDWSPNGYDRVVDLFERVRTSFTLPLTKLPYKPYRLSSVLFVFYLLQRDFMMIPIFFDAYRNFSANLELLSEFQKVSGQ